MLSFLKYTLATIFGLFLFMILSLVILVMIGSAASTSSEVTIGDKAILELNLAYPILEKEEENPFEDLDIDFPGAPEVSLGLKEIKEVIDNAAKDDRIKAIYLNTNQLSAGFSTTTEIRQALIKFKESGKPIIAYGQYFSENAYHLVSVADEVHLHPGGSLEFDGFNYEMMFFKGTLDKLDLNAEVIKVGTYKSFAEPFVLESMSEANRTQITSFIGDIYDGFLQDIAVARGKPVEELQNVANVHGIRLADDALRLGFVDALSHKDEVVAKLKESAGLAQDEEIELVSYFKYKKVNLDEDNTSTDRIAILVAQGEIQSGESGDGILGSATFAKELKELRENDRVKAIVIRINSPGGSAIASEVIGREIELTKAVKPVIASMSDVAASGGYWMAMVCDKIVAQSNTVTGSIGVIGLLINADQFLKNKLGITIDKVKTAPFADIANGSHKLTDQERAIIQTSVNEVYETFTTSVAKNRNLPIEKVREIAEGRVWTGNQAKTLGLVDELGNLDEAVALAAESAGITEYRVRFYPPKENFFDKMFNKSNSEWVRSLLGYPQGRMMEMIEQIDRLQSQQGIVTRLPYGTKMSY